MAIKERLMLAVAIIIASGLLSSLYAISDKAKARIMIVKKEARKYKINGESYESTICGKYGVETYYGLDKRKIGDDGKSYGDLQIQVSTVRQVAKWFPEYLGWTEKLSDLDIAKLLLTRLDFSAQVATLHLKHYMEAGWSYEDSVIIYNGWWQVDENGKAIIKNGKKVIPSDENCKHGWCQFITLIAFLAFITLL